MRDIASSCSIHSLTTRLRIPLIGRANLMRTRKSFRSLIDTSGAKTLLHTTSFETFVVMAVISAVFCVASALIPASVLLRDDFRLVAPIAAIAPLLGCQRLILQLDRWQEVERRHTRGEQLSPLLDAPHQVGSPSPS